MICDYCGSIYETQYSSYVIGCKKLPKDCCSKCTGKKSAENSLVKRRDVLWSKLTDICDEKGYILITEKNEFINVKMHIKYICLVHGETCAVMDNLMRGHGYLKCKNEEMSYIMRHNKDYIRDYINSFNNNILLNADEYTNMIERNLKIKCRCGNIYTTSFANYKSHNVRQCISCSSKQSKNESHISSILQRMNIEFIPEKRFYDCRHIRPLPFDFYLPNYNLIIEYDGEGHYFESFYDGHAKDSSQMLIERQINDSIKDKYCQDNNITILRIPYWEQENIEKIITEKLQNIN